MADLTPTPTCYLAEDGEHFWFDHECRDVGKKWADAGHPLDEKARAHFQSSNNHYILPLGGTGWTLVNKDPLTISPSILCGECGIHGFFENGKWRNC